MANIKIPTPLRAYTGGQAIVEVQGPNVASLLDDLTGQYPELRPHLFDGEKLRSFVNIFIGQEDIRFLEGLETEIDPSAELRIIPSIAGGVDAEKPRFLDQNALRTNQAFVIGLLLLAFLLDFPPLVIFVSAAMLLGALVPELRPFVAIYQYVLKPAGVLKPDVQPDNPEPHRFSMGLGGIFTALGSLALLGGAAAIGWALSLMVVGLAALNLFAGICVGCLMYYQLNRLGVSGFTAAPIQKA